MLRTIYLALVLLPMSGFGQTPSRAVSVPSASQMAQADVALIEYVGGSALLPSEKQAVAAYIETGLRRDPKSFTNGYLQVRTSLNLATYHNACATGQSQENWRKDFENFPVNDAERLIMERHDPILASRKDANGLTVDVVTDRSLRVLREAAVWAYAGAGLAMPPSGELAREEAALQRGYASYSPELQLAYAHIESNFPTARAFLASVSPAQARGFLKAQLETATPEVGTLSQDAAVALLTKKLSEEVHRRGLNPVKLCLTHSGDPLMQMYTYNARRDAWNSVNP